MNIKHISAAIILAIGASFSASPANAVRLDLGTTGANSPAFSTMSECSAVSSDCIWLFSDCGGYDIYSNKSTAIYIYRVIEEDRSVHVNTVVNGRFDDYLCELYKK